MQLFDPQGLASVIAQQNPVMAGLKGAQATTQTMFQPQQLQAKLQAQLLQNQMNQAKMKTLPDLLQAQLKQAQVLPGLTKARASLTAQQSAAFPETQKQAQARIINNAARNMLGYYRTTAGMADLSQKGNEDRMAAFSNLFDLSNRIATGQDVPQNVRDQAVTNAQHLNDYSSEGGAETQIPMMTPQQQMAQMQAQQSGEHPNSYSQPTVQAMVDATKNVNLRKQYPDSQLQQISRAGTLEDTLQEMDKEAPDAMTFASLAGAANKKAKQFAAAGGGQYDQAYENFQKFKDQGVIAANELNAMTKGVQTKEESATMKSLMNPITWENSPELAMQKYLAMRNLARKYAAQVAKPVFQQLQQAKQLGVTSPVSLKVSQPAQPAQPQNKVIVVSPDGQRGYIPAGRLAYYKGLGYKEES
ncbi:MAG: hypothetical protein JSW00_04085 [Thermoplasmata archaeon]|nr:MAG: hypothetical protein JSW00_04085 [Thermoplasmata archaeon]